MYTNLKTKDSHDSYAQVHCSIEQCISKWNKKYMCIYKFALNSSLGLMCASAS